MRSFILLTLILCTLLPVTAAADAARPSPGLSGFIGLNIVPSARMEPAGTIRAAAGTSDPYLHTSLSLQPAAPLNIALRQSAEISSLTGKARNMYPGLDLRLRLREESAFLPAVVIGLQSAVGHKRMAGEYLALSKRYHDFDFTAGLGWGRFGSAGT